MDMASRIGFIGTGNMGASILRGILRSGLTGPENIYIFDPDTAKMEALTNDTGVRACSGNVELVGMSDYVILAVKPAAVPQVLQEVKESFTDRKVLVSIAAGISIDMLAQHLGQSRKIVRTMPNLPLMAGEGMTVISFGEHISEEEKETVKNLFRGSGQVEVLEERLMNEVIALTGSSPAYVFMMIEAMADGAVQQGIPRKTAYRLAAQSVLGSAKMVLETGLHPAELKDRVCSPGGTSIEAVKALEKCGLRHAIMSAMKACTKRAVEISSSFESR
jgi:pyrroline-5-carboxylate reductase